MVDDGCNTVRGDGLVADEVAGKCVCVALAEVKSVTEDIVDCEFGNESTVADHNWNHAVMVRGVPRSQVRVETADSPAERTEGDEEMEAVGPRRVVGGGVFVPQFLALLAQEEIVSGLIFKEYELNIVRRCRVLPCK
jgi:hypothetical protein